MESPRVLDKLVDAGKAHVLCSVSKTALAKSILDATKDLRSFLVNTGVHNFNEQAKGDSYKVALPVTVLTRSGVVRGSAITMYRSRTRGDARFWVRDLSEVVLPGDYLIFVQGTNGLLAFSSSIPEELEHHIYQLVGIASPPVSTFERLLADLRGLAGEGFMLAPDAGSSSIGRLLEQRLGIPMNSSKNPDYHGIEIKSSRSPRARSTLFSQVPSWDCSRLKSSTEVLKEFGYTTPEGRKLSCTLSVPVANSQGLFLHVDRDDWVLHARHNELNPVDVVAWPVDVLERRFVHKHFETVWVNAVSRLSEGKEYVRFVSVEHTTGPIRKEFSSQLRRGGITVDFLIREDGDKGYLFKASPTAREVLFASTRKFSLIDGE